MTTIIVSGDEEALMIRKWFSKFFGLYYKQHTYPGTFDKEDFNCHELVQEKKGIFQFRTERPTKSQSYIRHEAKDRTIKQIDEYNCGVLSIIQCIELFNGEEKFHHLDRGVQRIHLQNFRLSILSLIRDLYDCLNGKFYNPHENHLKMKVGNFKEERHLDKYRWTIALFKQGYYQYEQNKTTHNSVWSSNNYDQLRALYRVNVLKKSPTSPQQSDKTSSPCKTSRKPSVFYDNDDDVPMQSLNIKDIVQTRGENSVTDVNNVKLFFNERSTNDEDATHPRDIVARLKTFFYKAYISNECNNDMKKDFKRDLKNLMERHATYFVIDKVKNPQTGKDENAIAAAVIFEHTVHLDLEKHSILHLMAVRPGLERGAQFAKLMFTIANTTRLKGRKLVVITRFGKLVYQMNVNDAGSDSDGNVLSPAPEQMFLGIGFTGTIQKDSLKKSIAHLCQDHSLTLYGDGYVVKRRCSWASMLRPEAKVFYLHGNVKFMARFNSEIDNFELYDHPFGWRESTHETIQYISKHFREVCKEYPDRKLSLGGGGHRRKTLGRPLRKEDKVQKLPDIFTQQAQDSQNNCVWLSAVLLIGRNNYDLGVSMIKMLADNKNRYEWMFLMKIPSRFQEILKNRNCSTLFDALQDKRVKYTLRKIDLKKLRRSYMEHILHPETTGQYLCQLQASGGDNYHVIAIDCNSDPKVVLDPYEKYALKLSRKTIDHCCGSYLLGAQGFFLCYELTTN